MHHKVGTVGGTSPDGLRVLSISVRHMPAPSRAGRGERGLSPSPLQVLRRGPRAPPTASGDIKSAGSLSGRYEKTISRHSMAPCRPPPLRMRVLRIAVRPQFLVTREAEYGR